MKPAYDVVIVGGAVIGSAVAYDLMANPDFTGSVLVVERGPTYARAATSLSSSSIRMQFANPSNVKISRYGGEVIKGFGERMQVEAEGRPDLNVRRGGYLFLAGTAEQEPTLRENHAVQRACGADVVLREPEELGRAFPHLRVADIRLASYGRSGEGWFSDTGRMNGFKAKARAGGGVSDGRGRGHRPCLNPRHIGHAQIRGRDRGGDGCQRVRPPRGADGADGGPRRAGGTPQTHPLGVRLRAKPRRQCRGQSGPLAPDDRPLGRVLPPGGTVLPFRRRPGGGSGHRLGRLRAAPCGIRWHHLDRAGRTVARLRGDQGGESAGRAPRLQRA